MTPEQADETRRWIRRRMPSHVQPELLALLDGPAPAPAPGPAADALAALLERLRAEVGDPARWIEARLKARRARVGGMAKARQHSRALKEAAIERHQWKLPLDSPDFVERVLEHFARSGEPAPSERFIRKWRDAQISARQHNFRGSL